MLCAESSFLLTLSRSPSQADSFEFWFSYLAVAFCDWSKKYPKNSSKNSSNLQDLTSSMGFPSFIPGSHTWHRQADHFGTVTPVTAWKSWLAFDNRILHRGEANLDTLMQDEKHVRILLSTYVTFEICMFMFGDVPYIQESFSDVLFLLTVTCI